MSSLQRRVGMLILIALVIKPIMIFAQENSTVTVVGSGILAPLIQAYAADANVDIDLNVTGTNSGFAAFCRGEADVTTATRSISTDEESACRANGVSFLEFVLGYDVMAVIANPSTDFGQCLTTDQLNALFAPSSIATNWDEIGTESSDIPLSLYVPPDNTTPFALLDSLVEGVGLRNDLTSLDSDSAVIFAVSSTSGALGVVSLLDARAAGDAVTLLDLNTTTVGCASASAENAAGRTYDGAYTLYAYANADRAEAVTPLLDAAFAGDNATTTDQGFVAASGDALAQDRQITADVQTGRQFTKEVTAFEIPANLAGTINIAGSATGADYVKAVTGTFVQQYPGVTINQTNLGEPDGVRRLCNGEADLISAIHALSSDEQNNCDANNIPTESYYLGSQAVVIVGNGDFLTCLTTDELATVWNATSQDTITNWNQVNASFPDLPITLVAPSLGDPYADLLMIGATGIADPTREDFAETKTSAVYRSAAVGNVEGAMTYMSWLDFQNLAADTQASAQVVAIGSDCVTPNAETISDGTYPLSRPLMLIVNRLSMAREEVQSLLWTIASDANFSQLQSSGYTGLSFSALPDLRDNLEQTFIIAKNDLVQRANATPEPTAEATAQATAESTPAS